MGFKSISKNNSIILRIFNSLLIYYPRNSSTFKLSLCLLQILCISFSKLKCNLAKTLTLTLRKFILGNITHPLPFVIFVNSAWLQENKEKTPLTGRKHNWIAIELPRDNKNCYLQQRKTRVTFASYTTLAGVLYQWWVISD